VLALLAILAPLLLVRAALAQGSETEMSPREVRELGRLERGDMVPVILPFLDAGSAAVRAEAANALAQSLWPLVKGTPANDSDSLAGMVARALATRLGSESDPEVVASIAQALGRLPYGNDVSGRRAAEAVLARRLALARDARIAAGVGRGLLSLVSAGGREYVPSRATLEVLGARVRGAASASGRGVAGSWPDSSFAWPRRLAMLTLIAGRSADESVVRAAAMSRDAQLRMLAVRAAGTLRDGTVAAEVLGVLARDGAAMVRTEVAHVWPQLGSAACLPLLRLARDSAPQTSVSALDAMGTACAVSPAAAAESALVAMVEEGARANGVENKPERSARIAMHRAAHALVALAHIAPVRAAHFLRAASASPAWQARMYAARAAAALGDTSTLAALAADGSPNVRTEAVAGLSRVAGHAMDDVYIDALSSDDYQLVLTAAHALRGAPSPAAASAALVGALGRITAEKRETSRDPRLALLATLRDVGSAQLAERLLPHLVDFDPAVADSAAAIVSAWTGRVYRSAPRPLPDTDEPPEDVESLRSARVRITMARGSGGGSFELRLLPDDAPVTVSRFVRLARRGYYDGLTMHRVVPNFVVQGGSPGANEYVGDGPFLRDEVGLRSHRRRAVGISTRGRNTGDAQIFVDLVDLPRLDHDYTVFAEVVNGMATVDQLLEGDVMEKVEIVTPP